MDAVEPKVVRVPYEEGAYWRKGAKAGPDGVMEQFYRLREFSLRAGRRIPYNVREIEGKPPHIEVYNKQASLENIQRCVTSLIQEGLAPCVVGGDHSVTLPVLRSLADSFGAGSFQLLHIDAHSDTFDGVDGYEYHHGAFVRNAINEKLIAPQDVFQFGVRGLVRGDGLTFADKYGVRYFSVEQFRDGGLDFSRFGVDGGKPVYVSIDIDAVDPAYAPGTGTPVPGGFTSGEMLTMIERLAKYEILGMDLMEVAPVYDMQGITQLLAAHMLFESLVGFRFVGKAGAR